MSSSFRLPGQTPLSYTPPDLRSTFESPLISPPTRDQNGTVPSGLTKTNPQFHLLIPASETNPNLCKTLLSTFALAYPPPTLINYGKAFDGEGWDKGSHAGKIRGVYEHLTNDRKIKDDDMVLVIDGFDIWFQLPPIIMIRRYYALVKEANQRLRRRYGTELKMQGGSPEAVAKYSQRVIFGADKLCWPNPRNDPACAAVPFSTLPKDVYGVGTDMDPESFRNRPRYLNSGTLMGPVADVRAIYKLALEKVEKEGRGRVGDQFVFAEIFGEQEFLRETQRQSSQSTTGRWVEWISSALGGPDSPLSANQTINNVTIVPGRQYEFGIGLDYESQMFQTMTHSGDDVEFVSYNDSESMSDLQDKHFSLRSRPFAMPVDVQLIHGPLWFSSPGNLSEDVKDGILLPWSDKIDTLPERLDWYDVPLATNLYAPSVPTLLHFNGDKSLLGTWWPKMWYHPYARALLRRFIRSTQTRKAAQAAAAGGQTWWDTRGGRGGVWTDRGLWMAWGEVCKKTEEEVLGDGKGRWGKEEGTRKLTNSFGLVMVEDEDDEKKNG